MTAPQDRNGSDVVPLFVALNDDRELALGSHRKILARRKPRPANVRLHANTGRIQCPQNRSDAGHLSPQLFKEQADRLDPAVKIWDVKLLVWRVQVVVGKPEAHHHRWNLEHVLEVGHDWNR